MSCSVVKPNNLIDIEGVLQRSTAALGARAAGSVLQRRLAEQPETREGDRTTPTHLEEMARSAAASLKPPGSECCISCHGEAGPFFGTPAYSLAGNRRALTAPPITIQIYERRIKAHLSPALARVSALHPSQSDVCQRLPCSLVLNQSKDATSSDCVACAASCAADR